MTVLGIYKLAVEIKGQRMMNYAKFSFLFLFLFFNTFLLFSQNLDEKPISINGFGKLQLGMSKEDIAELSGSRPSLSFYDGRMVKFELRKIEIIENVKVKGIELWFFDNHLFSIGISDAKMDGLIVKKYGDGEYTVESKENVFQNGYGARFIKTDETRKRSWIVDNPSISLKSEYKFWYRYNGELDGSYEAELRDYKYDDEMKILRSAEREKERIIENEKNKVELKDF
jgi:hypothetical protein